MGKIFWFDVETTGVNCTTNAIIQLSGIMEFDKEVIEEVNYQIRPFPGAVIEKIALEVNGIKEEDLISFAPYRNVYFSFINFLNKYVDKYTKEDKIVLAGYNVGFDEGFLRNFFTMNGDRYFGSYFAWPKIDVAHVIAEEYVKGLRLSNFRLGTICEKYGVAISAHDAMSDIRATRDLYYKINGGVPIS